MTVSDRRGTRTPTVPVSPRRSAEAAASLRYPSSAAAARTRRAVGESDAGRRSSRTREAVDTETPARAATSLSLTAFIVDLPGGADGMPRC